MDSHDKLTELFSHFPGIGPRQAKRFVYFLMNKPTSYIKDLIQNIEFMKSSTIECKNCHRFFIDRNKSNRSSICTICSDESRENSVIMIVARDSDLESIEKSNAYKGQYFILGGTIPILDKEPEKRVRLKQLLNTVNENNEIKEVIISMNTTPEGENTGNIIEEAMKDIIVKKGIKITHLGRGLSTGAELEYADGETIRSALKNRS